MPLSIWIRCAQVQTRKCNLWILENTKILYSIFFVVVKDHHILTLILPPLPLCLKNRAKIRANLHKGYIPKNIFCLWFFLNLNAYYYTWWSWNPKTHHGTIQCHWYLLVIFILCQNNDEHYIGFIIHCYVQSGHSCHR